MRQTDPTIWAFDFDGTLSPIVANRDAAALDPDCRMLLEELSADPRHMVAVLSSRCLDDLFPRVPVKHLYLAGSSGLEWQLPDGSRTTVCADLKDQIAKVRQRVMPALAALEHVAGVDIEDKQWSVAVHYRQVVGNRRANLVQQIDCLRRRANVTVFGGPDVSDFQFLPGHSKVTAMEYLSKAAGERDVEECFIYAGDDQNDACAMQWVLARGGQAICVGEECFVCGAALVSCPAELARFVRRTVLSARALTPGGKIAGSD